MNSKDIDFRPLAKLAKTHLIPAAYFFVLKSITTYIGLLILSAVGVANYFLIDQGILSESFNFLGFIFILGIFLFNVFVINSYTKLRRAYWKEFATLNGWEMTAYNKTYIPPSIANYGVRERWYDLSIQTDHWVITPYRYETSNNRYSRTVINTILSTKLPKALPYIAIDSKKNLGGLVEAPKGFEIVELEGDVKEYFIVNVQKGLYTDALSILTPDVLAVLVDECKDYDIEIVDNMLYMMATKDIRTTKHMQKMYAACESLRTELLHRAQSLNYEAGKKFEFRGGEHSAITYHNAKYSRSIMLEIKRTPLVLKAGAMVLLAIFLYMYIYYLTI